MFTPPADPLRRADPALVAARAPKFAGVDPYNKLIDRDADDNTIRVGG